MRPSERLSVHRPASRPDNEGRHRTIRIDLRVGKWDLTVRLHEGAVEQRSCLMVRYQWTAAAISLGVQTNVGDGLCCNSGQLNSACCRLLRRSLCEINGLDLRSWATAPP